MRLKTFSKIVLVISLANSQIAYPGANQRVTLNGEYYISELCGRYGFKEENKHYIFVASDENCDFELDKLNLEQYTKQGHIISVGTIVTVFGALAVGYIVGKYHNEMSSWVFDSCQSFKNYFFGKELELRRIHTHAQIKNYPLEEIAAPVSEGPILDVIADSCCICLEKVRELIGPASGEVLQLKCESKKKHITCKKCLIVWLENHKEDFLLVCPICRSQIVPKKED